MTENELYLKDIAIQYADKNITTIPVNCKSPVNNKWNDLPPLTDEYTIHDRLDFLWDTKFKTATGIGILLGAESDNLACCDIDSYDEEIVNRLLIALNGQYVKRGMKGCSFFFVPDFVPDTQIEVYKIPSGGQVEIFFGNKQTVIPPSLHSVEDNGEGNFYTWDQVGCTLLDIHHVKDLPSLSREQIDSIPIVLGSSSLMAANKSLPVDLQYDLDGNADGRFMMIKSIIGKFVARKGRQLTISSVVAHVLEFDAEHFSKNSFFVWAFNKKHKEIKNYDSREVNATRFCTEIISSLDRNNKIYFEESSSEVIPSETMNYRKLRVISLENKKTKTAYFDASWIPTVWRDFILEVEQTQGIPRQVTFFAMLCTLGACLQSKIKVQPYFEDPWFTMCGMTIMVIAPSGAKKSDIIRLVTHRARIIQDSLETANGREILDRENAINSRIETLRKAKTKADAGGEDSEVLTNDLYAEQDKLIALSKELVQTEWMDELGTIQKMIFDASKNQDNGMFLVIDEFNQIRSMKKKKGNEEAHNFFMRMIDGNGSFTTKTFIRGKDRIEKCVGSILTACQPDVYDTIIADLNNPRTDSNDGFMQRFPPISFGKPIVMKTKPLDFNKHKKAFDVFEQAFNMHPKTVAIVAEDHDKYEDMKLEIKERAGRIPNGVLASFVHKHEGMIAKFGYYSEFLRHNGKELGISSDGLDESWNWLKYMHDDLLDIFSASDELIDIKEQVKVIEMINKKMLIDGQTISQWYQVARGSFRFFDRFTSHLDVLESHGYIMFIDIKANSRIVKINPEFWLL